MKFHWPVVGKIMVGFCKRLDDKRIYGIELAVSPGTDVHAAEGGRIAYAGNELKDFGNLILIRHQHDWVSAYAYNDEILVKRGDVVKPSQVIARIGSPGPVAPPRLHFELRRGSTPVDPLFYLETADITRMTSYGCGRSTRIRLLIPNEWEN